jgi:hypothetical protein
MTISPDKVAELRLKHLEMLQSAVARMAGVGVTIKNYCITITTAVCGFSITLQRPSVALLAGMQWVWDWQWERYQDYTDPVKLPRWLTDPAAAYVTPLANNAGEYDYIADDGHKNIGAWIDRAAQGAGR